MYATSASAQDMSCGAVKNGPGVPVINGNGEYVLHAFSQPCPETVAATPAPVEGLSISSDVAFDFDQAVIKPEFYSTLDNVADQMNANPNTSLSLVGHTDSIGTEDYNQGLSERRARAVAEYLETRGVAAGRLTESGDGELNPIADNSTAEGRAQNRRVVLTPT
jgi:OOP family OmpA-OmpF porin